MSPLSIANLPSFILSFISPAYPVLDSICIAVPDFKIPFDIALNSNYDIKVYYVKGCKVSGTYIFNGFVLNVDDEPIIDSIKRKVDKLNLLCELTNEGFDYNTVSLYQVPMTELSLGDILLLDGYPCKYNSFMSRLHRWTRGDWQIISWLIKGPLNNLSK